MLGYNNACNDSERSVDITSSGSSTVNLLSSEMVRRAFPFGLTTAWIAGGVAGCVQIMGLNTAGGCGRLSLMPMPPSLKCLDQCLCSPTRLGGHAT